MTDTQAKRPRWFDATTDKPAHISTPHDLAARFAGLLAQWRIGFTFKPGTNADNDELVFDSDVAHRAKEVFDAETQPKDSGDPRGAVLRPGATLGPNLREQ